MENTKNNIIISNTNSNKSIEILNCDAITDSLSLSDKNHSNREEISVIHDMQDSSADLQWCAELDYEYKSDESSSYSRTAPKSIFESSLLHSSNSYATPPTSNYANISNNFDANLAEIDIETFKSEDINAVFLQAGEDCVSLSRSIFEDSVSLSSFERSHEEEDNSLTKELKNSDTNIDKGNYLNIKDRDQLEGKVTANDISVDSLDMSFLVNNTSELLLKCTEQDKKNYTIAFEGSIFASQEFIDLNQQKRISHLNKSNCSQFNYISNLANDRKMIKSEYLNRSRDRIETNEQMNYNVNCKSDRLILDIDRSIAKLSQSIPNLKSFIRMRGESRIPFCPVSGFLPLYDLQSSQSSNSHSSSSGFSPPRSLVKMFMQNRTSPLSSGQISPSLSYESRSQESASGNTSDSSLKPNYYSISDLKETNNNNNDVLSQNEISKTNFTDEEVVSYEDNFTKNKYRYESQKLPFSLKHTFPIKEVDETMSDSSNTDINMKSIDCNEINTHLSDLNKNAIRSHQSIQKLNNDLNYTNSSSKMNSSPKSISMKSKTESDVNSISSNYSGNRFGFESMNSLNNESHNRVKHQKQNLMSGTRTTSTQIPVHIQDKEVQASLTREESLRFVVEDNYNPEHESRRQYSNTTDSPMNEYKKPVYVYYPNYSLPDLSFLEEILEVHNDNTPKRVILSPTKLKLPNRGSVSVKMRQKNKPVKCRPKSYTDYETLSKQSFSHIKDWDSLNILLPNEFKELIQKAQNVTNSNIRTNTNSQNNKNDITHKNYDLKSNNNVRMRSHKSNVQLTDNSGHYMNRGFTRNKRFSLQEPYSGIIEHQLQNEFNSTKITSCMSRSQTMPNCHNACHCHQHCYHNCCHSCCRSPCHSPSTASAKPFPQTPNYDINASSIDKLCQLLAMDLSFKKMMNIINGQNVSSNRTNCETVPEMKEYLSNDNNVDLSQNNSFEKISNKDGSNFKQLRQRWESLATSPGSSTNTLNSCSNKKETNEKIGKVSNNSQHSKEQINFRKPVIAEKPKLVLRRPLSYTARPTTLNTENPVHSHRKSLIPVPKTGQIKSPTLCGSKFKSNIAFKQNIY